MDRALAGLRAAVAHLRLTFWIILWAITLWLVLRSRSAGQSLLSAAETEGDMEADRNRLVLLVLMVVLLVPLAQSAGVAGTHVETRVVNCLARLLPVAERARFVGEVQGDLGSCERWWQRVAYLVTLAIGTPRLALMMRREGQRRRA